MKIIHILSTNHFSGAENVACQIIDLFREDKNVEMIYCSLDGQIRESLKTKNIKFCPLVKISVKEIKRIIKEQEPDLIYAHDMRASFFSAKASGEIPIISHIHNNAFNSRGVSFKSIAYVYAARKAKHIFWVSQSSFEGYAFHKYFKNKSSVLYNIVDIEALYKNMKQDKCMYDYEVTYIGRLSFPKNPQRLMHIFKLLKEKMPSIKIAVVGTGELEEEIKELAKEYELLDNINFLGFQSNPLRILHDSKVMVMTSRWEGTPMCALEAMALGVPIVATPVDGLKDLVKNAETGFLTELDDEIVHHIISLVENENIREEMSRNSISLSCQLNDKESYKREICKALF